MVKRLNTGLLLSIIALAAFSQEVFFADGYHGGIYGHYPVKWKTRFIVDKFQQHPEWKISLEIEPETWDTVQIQTPEDYRRLQGIVTDKRVEFTNPTYAQPYCYNISGESLIRQFEYGIRKIRNHFPQVEFTTYSVEEPCFTSSLPQILRSFGFKYAVLKNPNTCWGGYARAYGGELVNWIGPDGTSILTVPRYVCESLEQNSTWQTTAWANSDTYIKACREAGIKHPAGMCFQDAGWKNGPWLGTGSRIKNNSTYITWKEYIETISIGKTNDNWRFSQEDVLVNLMWGSQVLQRIARQVRRAENQVVVAEKLGTMAFLENNRHYSQRSLDEAWRTLMLAQHHDSWIVPYNGLAPKGTWADAIERWTSNTCTLSAAIANEALTGMASAEKGNSEEGCIRVYNTLGTGRTELASIVLPSAYAGTEFILCDTKKKEVPYSITEQDRKIRLLFKAEVPSFGYATYLIKRKKNGKKEVSGVTFSKTNECIVENDMYRMVLDMSKGGVIKSLIAKKEGKKDFASSTGEYALGELRGFFSEDGKFCSSTEKAARITVLKDDALETSVQIKGEIATHPFTQMITLVRGQRRIDFDLTIDWKNNVSIGEYKQGNDWQRNRRAFCDDRFKLNVLFPVSLQSPQLYKDAPFDVCESKLDNTFFKTWDQIKHNIILHWIDLAEKHGKYGMALLSDHTTSYSYGEGFPLGLTVQYSGIGLWGCDYSITRPTNLRYALVPHRGTWEEAGIQTENESWNEPLVAVYHSSADMQNKSWIDIRNTGYEISAAYIQGDGVLLRLFNAAGDDALKKVDLNFPVAQVEEVDLNGKVLGKPVVKGTASGMEMQVSMPRFALKTFLIRKK